MLTHLSISNYALIHELSVDFGSGLNSVTGETGAGKSIILGALGLIMGNRADLSVLKNKNEKCVVEGVFGIENYSLEPFFTENELDYDHSTILRREITSSGKSRAFINDSPVTLKLLQDLALKLIDIHSQHQNLELGNQKFQLNLVDTVAGAGKKLKEYSVLYSQFLNLQNELEKLISKSEKANADLDYFQFQFNQLEEAKLIKGEQFELEAELSKLTHAEEIKSALLRIQDLIENERFSVIQNLKESQKLANGISSFIPEGNSITERLQSVYIELKDLQVEISSIAEKTEHDPVRIGVVNERLNLIYGLEQKHHVKTVEELIALRVSYDEKINRITGFGDEIESCRKKLDSCRHELEVKSKELTSIRKKSFAEIEKSVTNDLKQLGMSKVRFEVIHQSLPEFTSTGHDEVAFYFSANADSAPEEISKIASGGEMSRLMLAIKNLVRNSKSMPTVIFDEIDSGVSGEVAIKMGNILKLFSNTTQIINITHLPQIAAKGDTHFMVFKYEKEGKTYTSIRRLNESERVGELAKMVGGENVTEATLKAAREMLGH